MLYNRKLPLHGHNLGYFLVNMAQPRVAIYNFGGFYGKCFTHKIDWPQVSYYSFNKSTAQDDVLFYS